jgi:2-polyprenyl-3-methyl-5-hydroxy-6-metoxy-1,4-benzoquinol methylase
MINEVFYRLQRPERGWDPVPTEYVKRYATEVWEGFRQESVDAIESKIGPLRGRTVIDLGGGSGRFAIEFARRGAAVTWHDISLGYRNFVKDKLAELRKEMDQLSLEFSVGYLEDAPRLGRSFDFVFNRLCWCYSIDDFRFARVIYDLTKPGGATR